MIGVSVIEGVCLDERLTINPLRPHLRPANGSLLRRVALSHSRPDAAVREFTCTAPA